MGFAKILRKKGEKIVVENLKTAESLAKEVCKKIPGNLHDIPAIEMRPQEFKCKRCSHIAKVITQVRAEREEETKLECSECGMICDNLGQHIFCGKCQEKDFESRQTQISILTKDRDEWKKKFEDLNRSLMCELRDPSGTIWEHAKSLQDKVDALEAVVEAARKTLEENADLADGEYCTLKDLKVAINNLDNVKGSV